MNYQNADFLHFLLCLLTVQSWTSMAAPTNSCFHGPSRSAGESSRKCWSQRELWQCRHRQRHRPSSSGTKSGRAGQGRCLRASAFELPFFPKAPVVPGSVAGNDGDSFHCSCSTPHLRGSSLSPSRFLSNLSNCSSF